MDAVVHNLRHDPARSDCRVAVHVADPELRARLDRLIRQLDPSVPTEDRYAVVQWPASAQGLEHLTEEIILLAVTEPDVADALALVSSGTAHAVLDETELSPHRFASALRRAAAIGELAGRAATAEELQRYTSIVEGATECVWAFDLETDRYDFIVNRMSAKLGYDPEEGGATADWWRERVHPDDLPRVQREFARQRTRCGSWRVDHRTRCKDGSYKWIRLHLHIHSLEPPVKEYGWAEFIDDLKHREAEIERLNAELMQAHRQAGMAETASGVLHNVGNALNSIQVSAQSALDTLKGAPASRIDKALSIIQGEDTRDDPERVQNAARYIQKITDQLEENRARWIADVKTILKGVEHVSQSISRQQSYAANLSGVCEPIELGALVSDAIALHLGAHPEIVTKCEIGGAMELVVDKHKLMQVVVNLLRNAKHAAEDSLHEQPQIDVDVRRVKDAAVLTVTDNGVGMTAETQKRLFEYGFTTKTHGHGFGLHSSALVVSELGGELKAESDGPGRGAVFTLTLPVSGDPST